MYNVGVSSVCNDDELCTMWVYHQYVMMMHYVQCGCIMSICNDDALCTMSVYHQCVMTIYYVQVVDPKKLQYVNK